MRSKQQQVVLNVGTLYRPGDLLADALARRLFADFHKRLRVTQDELFYALRDQLQKERCKGREHE